MVWLQANIFTWRLLDWLLLLAILLCALSVAWTTRKINLRRKLWSAGSVSPLSKSALKTCDKVVTMDFLRERRRHS